MIYNWQQADWPEFTYKLQESEAINLSFAEETGLVAGMMKGLSNESQSETLVNLMVSEAIKTSEIEGEYFSREDIVSSIRNNLGLNKTPVNVRNKKAQGIGSMMVAVRQTWQEKLTKEILFQWHEMLMAGSRGIRIGAWRTHADPMQVISSLAQASACDFANGSVRFTGY